MKKILNVLEIVDETLGDLSVADMQILRLFEGSSPLGYTYSQVIEFDKWEIGKGKIFRVLEKLVRLGFLEYNDQKYSLNGRGKALILLIEVIEKALRGDEYLTITNNDAPILTDIVFYYPRKDSVRFNNVSEVIAHWESLNKLPTGFYRFVRSDGHHFDLNLSVISSKIDILEFHNSYFVYSNL